ncbi:MAG: hypothetical protein AAF327_22235 [Cyanobacteria bacterium P01_A01_bin.37]
MFDSFDDVQRSPSDRIQAIFPWLHLCILIAGFIGIGWLLAAFHVPWFIWLITLFLVVYLGITGVDGIALGSAWVVSFVSAGAVIKAWPIVWGSDIPHKAAKLWAAVLLLCWVGAIALITLLATASSPMQVVLSAIGIKKQSPQSILITFVWIALGIGWIIYRQQHPNT